MVAPDAGADKLVQRASRAVGLPSIIAAKTRSGPEAAEVQEIIGDLRGKATAVLLDDMVSSAGTVEVAMERLAQAGEIASFHVIVSHDLCIDRAYERLQRLRAELGLRSVVVTNSVPQPPPFRALPFRKVRASPRLIREELLVRRGRPDGRQRPCDQDGGNDRTQGECEPRLLCPRQHGSASLAPAARVVGCTGRGSTSMDPGPGRFGSPSRHLCSVRGATPRRSGSPPHVKAKLMIKHKGTEHGLWLDTQGHRQ